MSNIKKYIEKIVENGKQEDMECLSNMLDELICDMKENNPEKYKKYKMKLFGMAYNYHFDEDTAKELVDKMNPIGEYWNLDTTTQVKNQYGLSDINKIDFYIVMNSLANDYGEIISRDDVETYVKMAKEFIKDVDAIDNKVWVYFNEIPK